MLCENCPALRTEGYEYPEEYCMIQPDNNIYDFKGGCGCYLRLETIKKRVQEADDAYCKQCEDMAEWYVLTTEIEDVPETKDRCLSIINHTIGFSIKKGHTYTRNGKKYFKAWRNHFATNRNTSDYPFLRKLCSAGLATCDDPEADMLYYRITEKGFKWFGEQSGFIIKESE